MPQTPHLAPTGTLETPALQGRRFHTDLLGEQQAVSRAWQLLAFVLATVLGLTIIGLLALVLARQERVVYVEVDTSTGMMRTLATGDGSLPLRDDTLHWMLRRFVTTLRFVSPDRAYMERAWKDVFHCVTPRGYETLRAYAVEMNPLLRPDEVRVEVLHLLKQSTHTYDLRWRESTFKGGVFTEAKTYRGLFTWAPRPPGTTVTLEDRIANPAGVYLDTWNWSAE